MTDVKGHTTVDVETLARELHEAGRAAVEAGAVVNKVPGQLFQEWDQITEQAREGRRIQARYLLEHHPEWFVMLDQIMTIKTGDLIVLRLTDRPSDETMQHLANTIGKHTGIRALVLAIQPDDSIENLDVATMARHGWVRAEADLPDLRNLKSF